MELGFLFGTDNTGLNCKFFYPHKNSTPSFLLFVGTTELSLLAVIYIPYTGSEKFPCKVVKNMG
jgi:hypothetical protein